MRTFRFKYEAFYILIEENTEIPIIKDDDF